MAKNILGSRFMALQHSTLSHNIVIGKSQFSRSFSSLLFTKNQNHFIKIHNTKLSSFLNSVIKVDKDDLVKNEVLTDTYRSSDENIEIDGCVFFNLRSKEDGAACNIQNSNGIYSIKNSIFQDCRCERKGGALYIKSYSLVLFGNCFHLCRCGTPNGSDGSTIYADASDIINTSFVTCHECPKFGDMCWYGICNLWHADLYSNNINISKSEVEYVCSLAHCEPARKISVIKFYTSVNGLTGNSLTFVGIRFPGNHQFGNIVNNSVKSGLIYFQDSNTDVKEFVFISNSGPLTYSCVGISNGTFIGCLFDRKYENGNGYDSTVDCKIRFRNVTQIPMPMVNTFVCNNAINFEVSFDRTPLFILIGAVGVALLMIATYYKQLLYLFRKLSGRRFK
ncbi:hypothetical protein TVAG_485720 [Trichomonas vaginalis G3]|uniref:Uncharacterized protein n=1 Tax=Trichomonas vaginalis (strain ATCC PRA-98 / G3) TaxID=412133 RepID=A2FZT4_TRIV3|nr:hypothetical protein TVAGG3_0508100 [Trichomonas vaginalis G3]EAX89598.1 hypothetical protein TVAG_485720 [Trichomonas vaginalis G3]KAI5517580.1 hypothetical protein TVAGG3_0508100 [Trichomonas vaginalis G3]|eukprot:XP_001302528.1 hypothetical protein [Trichomonas vaginalis G3]